MMPASVMIFAAGLGTRMGALTRDRPKPLVPVAGRPLIDHALDLTAGLRRVVNLHYRSDMLRAHLAGRDVILSDESNRLRETGGGLKHAAPLLSDPCFTLNSDAVWTGPNPLTTLAAAWDASRMEALLLLLRPGSATGHTGTGDFTLTDGRLRRGPGLVYSGAQIIRTAPVAAVAEDVFSLNRVWDGMIARGTLFGVVHDGGWCDVGRPDSIPLAETLLAAHDPV